MVAASCAGCGRTYSLPGTWAGHAFRCLGCGADIVAGPAGTQTDDKPKQSWDRPQRAGGSESPEEPFETRPPPPPPIPGGVRAAGVLWVLVGALFVLGSCGGAVASVMIRAKQPGPMQTNPVEGCTTWVGVLMGVGFFIAGLRVVRGSAPDTLVTSILSILVGVPYLGLGVMAVVLSGNPPPKAHPSLMVAMLVGGIISVVVGCGLLLPAGLGLAGRSRYREWWAAAHPRPRRRRRRPPESDEGDGPWDRGRDRNE